MTNTERELIVINADTGRPVIDLDPIMVTVRYEDMAAAGYRVADGADERLTDVWEATEEYVVAAELGGKRVNLALVWSDTHKHVKAFCGDCGDPFDANDMVVSDPGLVCIPCFEAEES